MVEGGLDDRLDLTPAQGARLTLAGLGVRRDAPSAALRRPGLALPWPEPLSSPAEPGLDESLPMLTSRGEGIAAELAEGAAIPFEDCDAD